MLFNSIQFLLFLPLVLIGYWTIFSKTKLRQNSFLLVSSYVFYGFWDWRFLFLLIFSTTLDFTTGLLIDKSENQKIRKLWLTLSLAINLGFLAIFKYFNFFIESAVDWLNLMGMQTNSLVLNIVLPVGISFYTFHGISYIMDIYYRRIKPERNPIDYSLFVSYFPLLVAGPIERATHLLPQLLKRRSFNPVDLKPAISLILWGFFKKVVIADSASMIVNQIFENYSSFSSLSLIFGAFLFAFQIYADFSGYTDIARGVSKLFGIDLLLNFNFPYFSRSIPEFWSRWHISLSSFLNDYVFIPLALTFRVKGKWGIFYAVFLTFLISGIWHGAGWHFIFWGMLHGLFYLPQFLRKTGKVKSLIVKQNNNSFSLKDFFNSFQVFLLVSLALIIFRSNTLNSGFMFVLNIFKNTTIFNFSEVFKTNTHMIVAIKSIIGISILMITEYFLFIKGLKVENIVKSNISFVAILLLLLFLGSYENATQFIYFQF